MNPLGLLDRLLGHPIKVGVLRHMVNGQTGKTGREWAKLVDVSPPTLLSHLQELVDEGIVIRTTVGPSSTFHFNAQHVVARDMLVPLFQRERALVATVGSMLQSRLDARRVVSAILYGSVARGEAKASSDWDILILCAGAAEIPATQAILEQVLPALRAQLASTLDVKVFDVAAFCRQYHAGEKFPKNVYRDYLQSVTVNPLFGQSLTELLEAYGKKH